MTPLSSIQAPPVRLTQGKQYSADTCWRWSGLETSFLHDGKLWCCIQSNWPRRRQATVMCYHPLAPEPTNILLHLAKLRQTQMEITQSTRHGYWLRISAKRIERKKRNTCASVRTYCSTLCERTSLARRKRSCCSCAVLH